MNDQHDRDQYDRDWHELIDRQLRGELSESEMERLAQMLDSDPTARRDFVEQAEWDTAMTQALRDDDSVGAGDPPVKADRASAGSVSIVRVMLAVAAVVIVALSSLLFLQRSAGQREIAKITGLSGSHQWTGDGGRVERDLSIGSQLSGGTVEGMAPDSWVELEFMDGSKVTMSGNSMLTISDQGQKELHLREGNISANVSPQPAGRPLLVHTRSAVLEVLGTQFEVEAAIASTTLNVSEGKVRVRRLTDGSTVDVPAKHRVIAAPDVALSPVLVPDSVGDWKSQLQLGPAATMGTWVPSSLNEPARLGAIPYVVTTSSGKALTLYSTGFGVSRGDNAPVVLRPDSILRMRGRVTSTHPMYFGVTLRHPSGESAGKFETIKPATEFQAGQDFEVVLSFRDFRLVPTLKPLKDELPSTPFGLVVESFWCHTLNQNAGLQITEVELLVPTNESSP